MASRQPVDHQYRIEINLCLYYIVPAKLTSILFDTVNPLPSIDIVALFPSTAEVMVVFVGSIW
jgi:hypothetical protein